MNFTSRFQFHTVAMSVHSQPQMLICLNLAGDMKKYEHKETQIKRRRFANYALTSSCDDEKLNVQAFTSYNIIDKFCVPRLSVTTTSDLRRMIVHLLCFTSLRVALAFIVSFCDVLKREPTITLHGAESFN